MNGKIEVPRRLGGRVALVTGAAGGIGRAIARRLAAEGAHVLVTDIDAEGLAATERQLQEAGTQAEVLAADLTDTSQAGRLVTAALQRWSRLDILVNNATFLGARKPFLETDDADWNKVMATNVLAVAALCRSAAQDMVGRGQGSIINLGSIQSRMPVATHAAYVTSKSAIDGFTRALAVELSGKGVRVNTLAPGVVATEAFEKTLSEKFGSDEGPPPATLLERVGHADEIAAAVAFLASDDASFITGAHLAVDGGRGISRRPDPFDIAFGNTRQTGTS